MKYYQCWLRHFEGEYQDARAGPIVYSGMQLMAWIPDYGAKVGAAVELKGEDGWWEVVTVYPPAFDDKWLIKKRERDRDSLPSIKGK